MADTKTDVKSYDLSHTRNIGVMAHIEQVKRPPLNGFSTTGKIHKSW